MPFRTILKLALKSLMTNKLRTLLSMLGIIIGVGAVISMLAIGTGSRQQVMQQIADMGLNLVMIYPDQSNFQGGSPGKPQNLTLSDTERILAVPEVREVAPVIYGNVRVKYMGKNTQTNLLGTSITYFPISNVQIANGRTFTEEETERMRHVVVLGPTVATDLFGREDPIDKTVKINGLRFTVVGVQKTKGGQGNFTLDTRIIIPYTVAMKQLLGIHDIQEIDVEVYPNVKSDQAVAALTTLLRKSHRLQTQSPDDFSIHAQTQFLEEASKMSQTFTILLGAIGSISLIVGGIGIMNIMLVTVTERTREIGIRKAVGARDQDILRQFLFEAFLLSAIGGLSGVLVGVSGAKIIDASTEFKTVVEFSSIVLALSFALAVGIFFGYYPARRAARLNPIDALRYE